VQHAIRLAGRRKFERRDETAYETGYYSADDVRRLGLGMLLLTMVVVSLTIFYWGWLGLPLTQH